MISLTLLLIAALKPFLDLGWDLKFFILEKSLSIPALFNLLFLSLSVVFLFQVYFQANFQKRPKIKKSILTLYFVCCFFIFKNVFGNLSILEFSIKYLSSITGLLVLPYAWKLQSNFSKRTVFLAAIFSFSIVLTGMLLQVLGIIDGKTVDLFTKGDVFSTTNLATQEAVYRITGFYYHPLDVIRTLIWGIVLLLLNTITVPLAFLWTILFLAIALTTHRSSIFLVSFLQLFVPILQKNIKKLFTFLALSTLATVLLLVLPWKHTKLGFSVLFDPLHFKDSRPVTVHTPNFSSASKISSFKEEKKVIYFRGRSEIWVSHINWILSFSPKEVLFGTNHKPPLELFDSEPHQQFLDWIERYGIFGCISFFTFIVFQILSIQKTQRLASFLTLFILFFYSFLTETFVMPTFVWWSTLFLSIQHWLKTNREIKDEV
jgi:hypothetical protein